MPGCSGLGGVYFFQSVWKRLARACSIVSQSIFFCLAAWRSRTVTYSSRIFCTKLSLVLLFDLHGGMGTRSRSTANQQGQFETLPLHFLCDMHHFIERRCNQAAQTDEMGVPVFCRLQNFLARDHHAEIDDLEVVTLQDHADDVLADVMHVTFHSGHDDGAVVLAVFTGP